MGNYIYVSEGDPKPFMLITDGEQTYFNVFNHVKQAYKARVDKCKSIELYIFITDKYYPLKDYFK